MKSKSIITLVAVFGIASAVFADDPKPATPTATLPPASTKTGVTFAADIKPIFDASCVKCHSGDKPRAHLKLDSRDGVLAGAKEEGKVVTVITVGDSAKSPLVQSVAHLSDDDHGWMPPVHGKMIIKPLTPEQIGLIRAWIDQGAK